MGEGHLGDGLVDGALGLFSVQVPLDVLGVHLVRVRVRVRARVRARARVRVRVKGWGSG